VAEAVGEEEEAEEVPDWLKELEAPAAEEEAPEVETVPEAEEAPEWLRDLMGEDVPAADVTHAPAVEEEAVGPLQEEDLPDWLREWEEAEAAGASAGPVEETPAEKVAPVPAGEAEEGAIEPAIEAEAPEAGEEPDLEDLIVEPPAAAEPVEMVEAEVEAPPEREEAEVRREAPALEDMVMEPPVTEVEEAEVPAVEEEAEPLDVVAELEAVEPEVEAALPPEMEMVAPYDRVEIEEEMPADRRIDTLAQQLKANPRDYPQRLELARLYREERDWSTALTHYQKLISARKFLPAVLDDLGELLQEEADEARVYQLMGDAYMQQDELDKALEMYRLAQQTLIQR